MLYIVPTPIGNTEDITIRALRLFREINFIISENTFSTKKLLWIYDIEFHDKQFIKFTSHDHHRIDHIISQLQNQDGILVSEAGTPWLSDPGKIIIIACQQHNISYTILPGSTALIPAVVSAGFPTTQRTFLGFLPHKKWRETMIKMMIESDYPSFFYESVHRISKLLEQLEKTKFMGSISISREISKHFEQHITGDLSTIKDMIQQKKIPLKWEFVIGIYPHYHHEATKTSYIDTFTETTDS